MKFNSGDYEMVTFSTSPEQLVKISTRKVIEDKIAAGDLEEIKKESIRQEEIKADRIARNIVSDKILAGELNKDGSPRMLVSIYNKPAVKIMRVEIPMDIIDELNEHIDEAIIPAGKDHALSLVGQINRDKRSAQLVFPHDDGVGEQLSSLINQFSKSYAENVIDDSNKEIITYTQTMWTIHSYEGDYNPLHHHCTRNSVALSCILYLKVPPQIEALDNPTKDFSVLKGASGAVDGFTYFNWGANDMQDINMFHPATEEYVKPEVGTLIIFPSWLRHAVMPFFGEGERRTFSANINVNILQMKDEETVKS
jgi:hypothetical protein